MSGRCRSCGRRSSRRRRHRTVFSQPGFWLLVIMGILIVSAVQTGRV